MAETKIADSTSRPAAPLLEMRAVAKRFGAREVLKNISLDVLPAEFLTILGESGSGKTTLLRLIAGFEQLDAGEIWMAGERLDVLPPYRRRVNTVFQQYALFPHLSVAENIAYGLRVKRVPKAEIPTRVTEALGMVRMESYARASPATLSGGQQQRVALARALVNRPQLLLLDEPLSALDANLRRQMQLELKSLQREVGIAFLFVTHDQEEAMALSDRIALVRAGELEQVATPREIYSRPATTYTAQFIGQTNLLRGEVRHGTAYCGALAWPCAGGSAGPVTFSLRPETIRLAANSKTVPSARPEDSPQLGVTRFRAKIQNQVFGGATDLVEVVCADGRVLRVRIPSPGLLQGEALFEFSADDAIRVRDT